MTVATTPAPTNARAAHPLHSDERAWPDTNPRIDVWIELLHARRLDPYAMLAFTLGLDFEGDQFTCLRVPSGDLRVLYGIEVQELRVWQSLATHVTEQRSAGRVPIIEADAFFLPDTVGTSYRYDHRKTTIGVVSIDVDRAELRYLHGRGCYTLGGNDFAGVFRIGPYVADATVLPPFVEIAKLGTARDLGQPALLERASALARLHLAAAPSTNPIARYSDHLERDMERLRSADRAMAAEYADVTFRQAGSCFGLTGSFVLWLNLGGGDRRLSDAAVAFDRLAMHAKAAHLKIVRKSRTGQEADVASDVRAMSAAWDEGMSRLADRFAR